MSKKLLTLAALFATLTITIAATEKTVINELQYMRKVEDVKGSTLTAFQLDKTIYENIDSFSCIRILGDKQVPFRVNKQFKKKKQQIAKTCPSEIVSLKKNEADNSIEIIVKKSKEETFPSLVTFNTHDRNFDKDVVVYSGDSIDNFKSPQKQQPIYDYSDIIKLRKDSITIENTNATFYKFVISNVSEAKTAEKMEIITEKQLGKDFSEIKKKTVYNKQFHINNIVLTEISYVYTDKQPITQIVETQHIKTEQVKQTTEIVIDTFRQPISKLDIIPTSDNFFRKTQILKSTDQETWHRVTSAEISSLHIANISKENLKISFAETRTHYIKLIIYNEDSHPIEIEKVNVQGPVYYAEFLMPEPLTDLTVYYGGTQIAAPKYDINRILNALPNPTFNMVKLGQQEQNPEYNKSPKAAFSFLTRKISLYIIIIIVLITLAFVVASCIKKIDKLPEE